jgi:hypothetical protein
VNMREAGKDDPKQAESDLRHLCQDLNREDSRLRSCLLDAAISGLRLTRNPDSRELRRDAARVWAVMAPILAHDLDVEDSGLLPWLDQHGRLSRDAGRTIGRSIC